MAIGGLWRGATWSDAERRGATWSDAGAAMVGPFWKVALNLLRRRLDFGSCGLSRTRLTVASTMADMYISIYKRGGGLGCPKAGKSAPPREVQLQKMRSEGLLPYCIHLTSISEGLGHPKTGRLWSKIESKLKLNP